MAACGSCCPRRSSGRPTSTTCGPRPWGSPWPMNSATPKGSGSSCRGTSSATSRPTTTASSTGGSEYARRGPGASPTTGRRWPSSANRATSPACTTRSTWDASTSPPSSGSSIRPSPSARPSGTGTGACCPWPSGRDPTRPWAVRRPPSGSLSCPTPTATSASTASRSPIGRPPGQARSRSGRRSTTIISSSGAGSRGAEPMNVVLVASYECGHQPFGLASPAAWLNEIGARVTCIDLTRTSLDEVAVAGADLIAFHVPMHTATRLAIEAVPEVRRLNPDAALCFFGLYAAANAELLSDLGASVIAGEFEPELVRLAAARPDPGPLVVSLAPQRFRIPDRSGLPGLDRYAQLEMPDGSRRLAGYTEASRGCRHRCRH